MRFNPYDANVIILDLELARLRKLSKIRQESEKRIKTLEEAVKLDNDYHIAVADNDSTIYGCLFKLF